MKRDSMPPLAGLVLGMTGLALADLFSPPMASYAPILIAVAVGAVAGYVISYGTNRLPGADPKATATVSSSVLVVVMLADALVLWSELDSLVQTMVMAVAPFAGFRLVVAVVDRFTTSFTVSLIAGLAGVVVFGAAVPLLAFGLPGLSSWACIGAGAVVGLVDGVLVGAVLGPMFVEARG
ncbi:hypothetical protein [Kribbella sp. DT2]|uniref:hypothetical protein n=1 Tax=Kribbella sp. DT2 TaxID=3393427 RepID=UPI003CFB7653